jgi:hypothetical protein
MDREKLKELYQYYSLQPSDIFTKNVGGKSFTIIKRQGIEKIQSKESINISYDVIKCETNFAVIKANAYVSDKPNDHIETFGSALKGSGYNDGNCMSWYVAEMAEKRALSRAVLKLTGFYELGVMGEDESDDFKETKSN